MKFDWLSIQLYVGSFYEYIILFHLMVFNAQAWQNEMIVCIIDKLVIPQKTAN